MQYISYILFTIKCCIRYDVVLKIIYIKKETNQRLDITKSDMWLEASN
jgi:hypothetical protein